MRGAQALESLKLVIDELASDVVLAAAQETILMSNLPKQGEFSR